MSCRFEVTYIRGQTEQFRSSIMRKKKQTLINFSRNVFAVDSSTNVTYNSNTYLSILDILYKE